MIWILMGSVIISVSMTTYFVFYHPQKDKIKSKQIRQWIFAMIFLVVIIFMPLVLSTDFRTTYPWLDVLLYLSYILIVLVAGLTKRIKLNNNRYYSSGFFTAKILVLIFYVPLMLIYFFRREPVNNIVVWTVLGSLLVWVIFGMYQLLIRSRFAKIFRFINVFSIILFFFLLFAIKDELYDSMLEMVANTQFYDTAVTLDVDFESNMLYSFEDTNLKEPNPDADYPYYDFYDVAVTDNGIYYVTKFNHEMTLSYYSFEQTEAIILDSYEVPTETSYVLGIRLEPNTLEIVEDVLYYFADDGIYTLDDDTMTLVSEISAYTIYYFEDFTNGKYIAVELEENLLHIYELTTDGLNYIEEWDYTSGYDRYTIGIETYHLYVYDLDNNTVSIYGGETFETSSNHDYVRVRFISQTHIIVSGVDDFHTTQNYISYADQIFEEFHDYREIYSLFREHVGVYYMVESQRSSGVKTMYLYDDMIDITDTFKLRLHDLEQKSGLLIRYKMFITDEGAFYIAQRTDNYSMYIELNELTAIENTIDYAIFDYFSWGSIYVIVLVLLIPLTRTKQPWEAEDYPPKEVEELPFYT